MTLFSLAKPRGRSVKVKDEKSFAAFRLGFVIHHGGPLVRVRCWLDPSFWILGSSYSLHSLSSFRTSYSSFSDCRLLISSSPAFLSNTCQYMFSSSRTYYRSRMKPRTEYGPPRCVREPSHQVEHEMQDDEENDDCNKYLLDHHHQQQRKGKSSEGDEFQLGGVGAVIEDVIPQANTAVISACFVGLLTGISVVVFNLGVHEVRDFFWDGIQNQGASWLREKPIEVMWEHVVLVPASGGLVVSILNLLRNTVKVPTDRSLTYYVTSALRPLLKLVAACITLGTGNSLGPEGPSVEIGSSIAKGIGSLFDRGDQRKLSLKAAGSAAGISSGFNAAVAGCFFAVESVLWPSSADSSLSLTYTTSTVILSAVIASVVSEIGLGSEPAFTVPGYEFRSPSELPLYLLLGILCGSVSLAFSSCTSFMQVFVDQLRRRTNLPKEALPVLGGLTVGLLALAYPEILYWGFENVDILLESRPFVKSLSADILLQLVVVKIFATSLCRASGLVGGYYAPSLFIGAATGMAYGKIVATLIGNNPIFYLSVLDVASPQAYGLVGMAATLAGVCQVPLTAVLLLFELTQDYRIVLPLLGAVGVSSWITSRHKGRTINGNEDIKAGNTYATPQNELASSSEDVSSFFYPYSGRAIRKDLCELESSLCLDEFYDHLNDLAKRILVSQAMRTQYVTVGKTTLVAEAVSLMLEEKQSSAIVVDENSFLIGLLTLSEVEQFIKLSRAKGKSTSTTDLIVSELCSPNGKSFLICNAVLPNMTLLSACTLMDKYGVSQVPVMSEHVEDQGRRPVGILDNNCINLACRALEIGELLKIEGSD